MHLHKGVYPRFEDDLNGVIGLIDTELNTEQ